jgi:glycerate 2-kinase
MIMSKTRDDLKKIYTAAISSVDPNRAIEARVKRRGGRLKLYTNAGLFRKVNLKDFDRILVVGAGKAAAPMAKAIEGIAGDRITGGLVCVKQGYTAELSKIRIIEASHPVPDARGMKAAEEILDILKSAGTRDLVISLISGGGSSLLPLPPRPISLDEKRATTDLLLKSGAGIHEINAVRKHLSLVKGGNLAKATGNAAVLNLVVSDVVGDDLGVIASGPFSPDGSTFQDALGVLERYRLVEKAPASVTDHLRRGVRGEIEENPGADSPVFKKVTSLIVASNIIALEAAKSEAARRGYHGIILSSMVEGDARDAAFWHSRIAREVAASSNPVHAPACIISGGETTVVVSGDGLGGRNMEFALHAAVFIDGLKNITVASIGTDGTDGPTDAAGAVVDGLTIFRAKEKGMDIRIYSKRNDSYHFHKELDNLIITGPTNTNVMDVRIMLIV